MVVDTVFLCMALNNDFNLRRLERYLSVAWDSGAAPVILLTKADLCRGLPAKLAQVESVAAGVDIITVSALERGGCQPIAPYHQTEPHCAVRAALERGELSEARFLSWQRLRAENAWFEDAESRLAAKEKKFKRIARANRTNPKK